MLQTDHVLFISDLHLSPSRPYITRLFLAFLEQRAAQASALYILGDLFDSWVGDDDPTPPVSVIANSLRQIVHNKVTVNLMHGNRDFLLAERFAEKTGCHLLPDCHVIQSGQRKILIMHGDLLCTDDTEYQQFRTVSRTVEWQEAILSKPLWLRLAVARWYRLRSFLHKRKQSNEIMDVNDDTVWQYTDQYQVSTIIHGHTHRPGLSQLNNHQGIVNRYVLGEWGRAATILVQQSGELYFEQISLDANGNLLSDRI
ncbi:MAG: UDP-2,3-diacylglucosamine diphosphatase [Gammaproteobacteria bacterium]|nr:UDP-2,3-diacylglucosamine diphosphatase [Gammaproteobacteria bacterium]